MEVNTPSAKVWKQFKRNKMAFGGLLFIALLFLMGILGYLIIPDKTPMANTMYLQLSNKKPGRTFNFLVISRKNIKEVGFFKRMLYGQEANFKSIPITSYRIANGKVYAREYIGDDEQAEESE